MGPEAVNEKHSGCLPQDFRELVRGYDPPLPARGCGDDPTRGCAHEDWIFGDLPDLTHDTSPRFDIWVGRSVSPFARAGTAGRPRGVARARPWPRALRKGPAPARVSLTRCRNVPHPAGPFAG